MLEYLNYAPAMVVRRHGDLVDSAQPADLALFSKLATAVGRVPSVIGRVQWEDT